MKQSRRDFLQTSGLLALGAWTQGLIRPHASLADAITNAGSPSLWRPRHGCPTFVKPGETFVVEVRSPKTITSRDWTVVVRNDLRDWKCPVLNVETAKGETQANTDLLTARLPADAPPELFELQVSHASGFKSVAPQSVSGLLDPDSDFYLLHITDEHVLFDRAAQSSEPQNGYRSAQLVEWGAPVVNLINPRLVINSGDQSHQYSSDGKKKDPADLYARYIAAKSGYRVPSLMVPGNHDMEIEADRAVAIEHWERLIGPRAFTFPIGSLQIVAHDYSDPQYKQWTADTWNKSWNNPQVKGRLLVQHYADYVKRTTDWHAFHPPAEQPPTLMLIGHIHKTSLEQFTPFPVLMTVAAHRNARAGYIEFKKDAAGNWTCPGAATWGDASVLSLVGDGGIANVSVEYQSPNDGTGKHNRATITNKLKQSFKDGRVRFLMPEGRYSVKGGNIIASYPYASPNGQKCTAVLAQVEIGASTNTEVSIEA